MTRENRSTETDSVPERWRVQPALAAAHIAKTQCPDHTATPQLPTSEMRLPESDGNWKTKELSEIGHFLKGGGVKRDDARSGTLACVRYGEIYTVHHDLVRAFHSWISPKVAARSTRLEYGDILFAGSGETKEEIGKCVALVSRAEVYAGGDIVILRPRNIDIVDPMFLGYALNMPCVARQKASLGQGDAVVHVSAAALARVSVNVPSSIKEQSAIAAALGDVDALLDGLDRLISKKRNIKRATMQQLLTGRTRLPGFQGEWVERPLCEIGEIRSGGTPNTTQTQLWNGGVLWCTPTDVTTLRGRKYLKGTARTISAAGVQFSSAELIPPRSLIITSRATIGECTINLLPVTTNQGFKNIVTFADFDVEFLYYLMTTQKEGLVAICGGSTFLEIGKKQLSGYVVALPVDRNEQEAIAAVLSDMDAEIAALEARRDKTRNIKQAMMQELLTGRTRLVKPETAHA